MSLIKRWSVEDVVNQLRACGYVITDPNQDGFTTWGCKQDLYRIKFILDDILDGCPKYAPEQEWLNDQEKERTWKIISRK